MYILTVAILTRVLVNPFSNVFQKKLTGKGMESMWVNFVSFFLLSLLCIIPAISVEWGSYSQRFWIICTISGIFCALGNGFLVKALSKGDLSIMGPVNSYKSIVSMIFGIFLLGEIPGLQGVLGIVLIIFGSYFVLDTLPERFTWNLFRRKEIQYRFWAMVFTAIEAIFIKKIIQMSDVTTSFIVWCLFGAIFSFVLLLLFKVDMKKQLEKTNMSIRGIFLLQIICVGLMQFTTNYVFDNMNVSYALALFQLSTIVTVILGYFAFHEQKIAKKLLGSLIMIGGSVIILLFG